MYTIKQAARITGVPEASLRAWERRYAVVVPQRNDAGYRVYDEAALAALSTMRRLVEDGWAPAEAAVAVRDGTAPAAPSSPVAPVRDTPAVDLPGAEAYTRLLLTSAKHLDTVGIEQSLDGGFALGSFEHVVDSWLFPALGALGDAWSRGEVDVAGEHAASHAVHRRLSAAFDAAGIRTGGPTVVVGLPPGSLHALGSLAFATALRRRGLDVLYLGADVPVDAWGTAVLGLQARAAVLSVPTQEDRPAAVAVAERLLGLTPAPLVCAGGSGGADLATGVTTLADSIGAAAQELDDLVHSG